MLLSAGFDVVVPMHACYVQLLVQFVDNSMLFWNIGSRVVFGDGSGPQTMAPTLVFVAVTVAVIWMVCSFVC